MYQLTRTHSIEVLLSTPQVLNTGSTVCSNSLQSFQSFSPDCTLHTASTHVILVLEWQNLTHAYAIGAIKVHMRLQPSNTVIM